MFLCLRGGRVFHCTQRVLPFPVDSIDMKRPRGRSGEALNVATVDKIDGPVEPTLASLVHPMAPADFMRDVFRQKAYAVKVHPNLRQQRLELLKDLMDGFHPVKMLEQSNSESISVWMFVDPERTQLKSIKVDAAHAKTCYDAGHSLYFRGSEVLESTFLPPVAAQLGFGFGANHRDGARRSEIEVFASRVGHVTGWHFDFQENFTVQLRGRKKWSFAKASVPHPHRACATHFTDDANVRSLHTQHQFARLHDPAFCGVPDGIEETCESVILQEGDVLYHPAGVWHKVETVEADSNSLSINMSFFPASWGEVVLDTLAQRFVSDALFRERMTFTSTADAQKQLQRRLAAVPALLADVHPNDVIPTAVANSTDADGNARRITAVVWNEDGSVTVEATANPPVSLGGAAPLPPMVKRTTMGVLSQTEDFFAPAVETANAASLDSDDEDDEDAPRVIGGAPGVFEPPAGSVRFDYHSNFAAIDAAGGAPQVHVAFFVAEKHEPAFRPLALMSQAAPCPVERLKVPKELVRLLLMLGYLRPAQQP